MPSLSFPSVRNPTNLLSYTSISTFLERCMFLLFLSPTAVLRRGFTLEILRFYKFKREPWLKLLSVLKLFLTSPLNLLQVVEQCLPTLTHWNRLKSFKKNVHASAFPQRFGFDMSEMKTRL